MAETKDNWVRMAFKGNKVWAEMDEKGALLLKDGKVRIKYNPKQSHEYMVHPSSLGDADAIKTKPKTKSTTKKTAKKSNAKNSAATYSDADIPENAIVIHTDGACSGNPGPAGIGAVLRYKGHEKEISKYLGEATNNIAELTAILEALSSIKNKDLPVRLFTDSKYAYGVLLQGWKVKANVELVWKTQRVIQKFSDLKFYWVKGHADNPGNELADKLATDAVKKAMDS